MFLVAYAMSIDGVSFAYSFMAAVFRSVVLTLPQSIRYTLQGYATSSFAAHSLLTTMGVLQGVIGAAGQPIAAKLSDVFGRVELLIVGLVFYCVGTIVECTSKSVSHYSGGVVLFQIGYTIYTIIIQVIVTDLSSLQARLFVSFIPPSPYLINSWIAAEITPHFTKDGGVNLWRWGLGMLAIITPCELDLLAFYLYDFLADPCVVAAIFIIVILVIASRRAARIGALAGYKTPFQELGAKQLLINLFWQLDVIGAILLIASIGLFLVPFTLAGGSKARWAQADIIAPIVVGFCVFPVWVFWERKCQYPLVPFHVGPHRVVTQSFRPLTDLCSCSRTEVCGPVFVSLFA